MMSQSVGKTGTFRTLFQICARFHKGYVAARAVPFVAMRAPVVYALRASRPKSRCKALYQASLLTALLSDDWPSAGEAFQPVNGVVRGVAGQKSSFTPRVIWRWPWPFSPVMEPKAALMGVVFGPPNWTWFSALKFCRRNWAL